MQFVFEYQNQFLRRRRADDSGPTQTAFGLLSLQFSVFTTEGDQHLGHCGSDSLREISARTVSSSLQSQFAGRNCPEFCAERQHSGDRKSLKPMANC